MVICFECSVDTKHQIDELLRSGRYTTVSELMAVAVSNQVLLQTHADREGAVLFDDARRPTAASEVRSPEDQLAGPQDTAPAVDPSKRWDNGVSALFTNRPAAPTGPIAELSRDPAIDGPEIVPPSLWIFGQYNRLLPAKASCRALANLLVDARGIDPAAAAKKIAGEAAELGNHLRILDRRYERGRDDMFCTAFPGLADPDKGRLRYANQFVVSVDNQERLSGLLYDLKLINRVPGREPRISLTDAGWKFALLENPVLDSKQEAEVRERLSAEERHLLVAHISSSVPRERSAYQVILSAISHGKNTPDSISKAMKALERSGPANDSLIATQRSGAISRMSDLALLSRDRDGIRVQYNLSDDGNRFLRGR